MEPEGREISTSLCTCPGCVSTLHSSSSPECIPCSVTCSPSCQDQDQELTCDESERVKDSKEKAKEKTTQMQEAKVKPMKFQYVCPFPHLSDLTLISTTKERLPTSKVRLSDESKTFEDLLKDDLTVKEIPLSYSTTGIAITLSVMNKDHSFVNSDMWNLNALGEALLFAHAYEMKTAMPFFQLEETFYPLLHRASMADIFEFVDLLTKLHLTEAYDSCLQLMQTRRDETLVELHKLKLPPAAWTAIGALSSGRYWEKRFETRLWEDFKKSAFASELSFHQFKKKLGR